MKNILIILVNIIALNVNAQFSAPFTINTNNMLQRSKSIDSIDYSFDGYYEFYASFTINKDQIIWSEHVSDTIQVDQILITKNEVLYFWSYCDGSSYILAVSLEKEPYTKVWYRDRKKNIDYFCKYDWDDNLLNKN